MEHMKWIRKWPRAAIALGAVGVTVGVGTVAAQSGQLPWWEDTGVAFAADVVTTDGSVAIGAIANASGSLRKAKAKFPTTGEYIGCSVSALPDNGQFLTCVARTASGATLSCSSSYPGSSLTLPEQSTLAAAASINADSFVHFQAFNNGGGCAMVSVSNSSADFLVSEGGGTGGVQGCNEANSTSIGAFGGNLVTVPNDACVKVTQFAKPFWTYGPNRTMQLQNGGGTTSYPLNYEYAQSCTSAGGIGTFSGVWHDQFLPGLSDACPLFIKLKGSGSGTVKLKYY
jgi:hypothetical protein